MIVWVGGGLRRRDRWGRKMEKDGGRGRKKEKEVGRERKIGDERHGHRLVFR